MPKIVCLTTHVFIEIDDGKDPEEVRFEFEGGAPAALRGFPGGDVIETDVVDGHVLTAEEVRERGFEE